MISLGKIALLSAFVGLLYLPVYAQDTGADLFTANCQLCHGAEGKGDTPTGKAFKAPNFHDPAAMAMSDEELEKIISAGKGNMPTFQSRLTPQQIKSLVSYIHVLQKK